MIEREPRVHAEAVTDAEAVEQWGGGERFIPGVDVQVICTPSSVDVALRMLDEHVAEVRRQLARPGRGAVLVDGPDVQDQPRRPRFKAGDDVLIDRGETGARHGIWRYGGVMPEGNSPTANQ